MRQLLPDAKDPETIAVNRRIAEAQALTNGSQDALIISHVSKYFIKGSNGPLFYIKKMLRPSQKPAQPTHQRVIRALDDVSLTVKRNTIIGVLGSNGSGKSTLIRAISTLLIPDKGSVKVFDHDVIAERDTVQRLINRVSVEASFFRRLSPIENLMYSARLYNVPGPEARRQIHALLNRLGIRKERRNHPIEDMSRGMQQKVAIARAFLTSPILLLLDEPTTGLDPRSKAEVQQFILELRANHDATILLTTHDMDEAEALCDSIAIIDNGRIAALNTAAELRTQIGAEMGLSGPATLHDVFMWYTGRAWKEDEEDDDNE